MKTSEIVARYLFRVFLEHIYSNGLINFEPTESENFKQPMQAIMNCCKLELTKKHFVMVLWFNLEPVCIYIVS